MESQITNHKSEILSPVFHDPKHHIKIYQGDCLEILAAIPADCVDLIFADPPYFLSNDGITCHAGKMVSVNKGEWDRSRGPSQRLICRLTGLRLSTCVGLAKDVYKRYFEYRVTN